MVPVTKACGSLTKPVVEENSGMLMAMCLKENGSMIKPTDTESMST